jgi:hypothetical protein
MGVKLRADESTSDSDRKLPYRFERPFVTFKPHVLLHSGPADPCVNRHGFGQAPNSRFDRIMELNFSPPNLELHGQGSDLLAA